MARYNAPGSEVFQWCKFNRSMMARRDAKFGKFVEASFATKIGAAAWVLVPTRKAKKVYYISQLKINL